MFDKIKKEISTFKFTSLFIEKLTARIEEIKARDIIERLEKGQVAVVAGFQGIAPDGRISTLGRGGSDTSAVAIAAAI